MFQMILGFSGYLVFGEFSLPVTFAQWPTRMPAEPGIGLIIGCAYDKITKIIPLFVILCYDVTGNGLRVTSTAEVRGRSSRLVTSRGSRAKRSRVTSVG